MTLETGYLDCTLDDLLEETYHLSIGEVYDYIQNLIAEATGIQTLPLTPPSMEGSIYNLQGQRIFTPHRGGDGGGLPKGLYIVDGKKIWVK